MRLAPALLLLLSLPSSPRAAILCVKPGGGSGCHPTITSALATANDGDTIRIAAGTYAGNLVITKNMILEGGWNTGFTQHDSSVFITTVLPFSGVTSSVISIEGSLIDPSTSIPTLSGLRIATGRADVGSNQGGGIRIIGSNARITNTIVTGNKAFMFGGGVSILGGSPTFEDSAVIDNALSGSDGSAGSGVMIEDGSATFIRCSIFGNNIETFGGLGGGIAIRNFNSDRDQFLRIEDSVIADNISGASGNGYGGGIAAQLLDTPAPGKAGVFLDRVRFEGNVGGLAGGALSLEESPFEVTNSVFVGNQGNVGSAIYASDFSSAEARSPGSVRNCTLVGDGSGSGIDTDSPLEVVNSIVRGYASGIVYAGPAGGLVASHDAFSANAENVLAEGFALDPTNLLVEPQLDAQQHLLPGSPLIDAGRRTAGPFADIDGETRPTAGASGRFALDIGADEAPGEAQRVFEVDRSGYDLALAGPGIGHALLGGDWSGDLADDLLLLARDSGRAFGLRSLGARLRGLLDLVPRADLQIAVVPAEALGGVAGGDLDGDGRRDLALASPGAVRVLFGGPMLAGSRSLSASAPADFTLLGPGVGGALALGDLSGDGIADLVVGDASADDGAAQDAGAVSVFFGPLAGVRDLAAAPADLTIRGPAAGAGLGRALALADLDGDGDLDLAASDATRTHLLFGPLAAGLRRLAAAPASASIAQLGSSGLIALDLSGEGRLDLVGAEASRLRVVPGPFARGQQLDAANGASLELSGPSAFTSLAAADVLGDARAELIAGVAGGAYAVSSGAKASGRLPIDELASLAVADPASSPSLLGASVGASDLDRDGRPDLIVGDPGAGAGRAYVFYGGMPADDCPGTPDPDQADRDADGAGDACDRCPFVADPLQRDLGSAATPLDPTGARSDGIGDACQCGDVTADGRANAADLAAMRFALVGAAALAAPRNCNLRGPVQAAAVPPGGLRADCSLVDAAILARQLAGLPPGAAQSCATALGLP